MSSMLGGEQNPDSGSQADGPNPQLADIASNNEGVEKSEVSTSIQIHVHPAEGVQLCITIESLQQVGEAQSKSTWALPSRGVAAHLLANGWQRLKKAFSWLVKYSRLHVSGGGVLLAVSVLVYMITRLVALESWPIYFFTDEAVQTVVAADFVRDGFTGYTGEVLPAFFPNQYQYNLGTSIYLQVIPYMLFGKSVFVTRAVCVLVAGLAALWVGLALKNVFRSRRAWLSVLFLSISPAWFLHSRTAFETALAASFYAGFLYYYLRYRTSSPRNLYAAVVMAALVFYSYSPARMVILLSVALLGLSDLRYHWHQRRIILTGLGLGLLLAVPLIRFQISHPEENIRHLTVLNSYWIQPISIGEKLETFASDYLKGLNPLYWYGTNPGDMARHIMKDYGHILRWTLPLGVLGLALSLWKMRSAQHRALLLAVLAAPSGGALVEVGITRALIMVIPIALLTAIGTSAVLDWLEHRWKTARLVASPLVFLLLTVFNFTMLRDAVINGPLWYRDYGLGGMQYGAQQVFGTVKQLLKDNPGLKIMLSPSWANGTDTIARFFFADPLPFQMGSIEGYMDERKELSDRMLFIMIPQEYQAVLDNPKFADVNLVQTLPCPDGTACFYFVHLRYADNIDQILEAERQERRILRQSEVQVWGELASVSYSYLDMGSIENIFDGDPNTLVRTKEANPLYVKVRFEQSRPVSGISVRIGGTSTMVTVTLLDAKGVVLLCNSQTLGDAPNPRNIDFDFNGKVNVVEVQVDVRSIHDGEPAHVHLWEVALR